MHDFEFLITDTRYRVLSLRGFDKGSDAREAYLRQGCDVIRRHDEIESGRRDKPRAKKQRRASGLMNTTFHESWQLSSD